MHTRSLLSMLVLVCFFFLGCSEDDIGLRNQRLFALVNTSFVHDAQAKARFRNAVGKGDLSDEERICAVCQCAETHLKELKGVLQTFQPEVKTQRGPYGTYRTWYSADTSLLFELKGLIIAYEDLVKQLKSNGSISLERVQGLVEVVNAQKRTFYGRARNLDLTK